VDQPKEITKIKLGTVLLDCTTAEEVSKTADVTDRPVEKGEDISDHMKTKPYSVRLSGTMVNDPEGKIYTLENMMSDAELLEYIGKRKLRNIVITSFSTKQNKQISNGYDWDISLQSVRIAKPQTLEQKVKNPQTKKTDKRVETKVKQVTNAGRKQMQNTSEHNKNYTNQKSYSGKVRSQKAQNKSYNTQKRSNTTIKSYGGQKPISVDATNPVKARNKMLSTLTKGTAIRAADMTINEKSRILNQTEHNTQGIGGGR
jgi:hypothetical protein